MEQEKWSYLYNSDEETKIKLLKLRNHLGVMTIKDVIDHLVDAACEELVKCTALKDSTKNS